MKVGLSKLALRLRAVCVATDTGNPSGDWFDTLPKPTSDDLRPVTVIGLLNLTELVNVGLFDGAFAFNAD